MSGRTKEFYAYVIPSVLAFALSGVYTIVDGFFVGQSLGDIGLAAITLGYPVTALVVAVGTGLGLAAAIRFTILNAQSETQKAQECFSAASLLMLLTAAVLTALLFFFADPILGFLGARNEALRLAAEYARIIALGAVFQLLATGFVPFIRNMGGASFAMVAMILGFVTNIVLDYALVWVANWGMAGAALATIIGQAVTMLAAIVFFVRKKCRLRLPEAKRLRSFWGETLKVSLSPFGLTFSPTVTMMLMNRFLLLYGDEQAVAIYGCIGYIISIIYLLLQGVGDGSQPLISEQYGRGDRAAVLPCAAAVSGVCAHHDLLFLCDRGDDPVVHHSLRRARVHAFAATHSAAVFEVNGRMARRPPRPNRHLCRRLGREQGRKTKSCLIFQTAFFVTPYLLCRRSVWRGDNRARWRRSSAP